MKSEKTILKKQYSLSEFGKNLKELNDRELKIKKERDDIFTKPIRKPVADLDKCKKRRNHEEETACKKILDLIG